MKNAGKFVVQSKKIFFVVSFFFPFIIFVFFLYAKDSLFGLMILAFLAFLYLLMCVINFKKSFFEYAIKSLVCLSLVFVSYIVNETNSKSINFKTNKIKVELVETGCSLEKLQDAKWHSQLVESGWAANRVFFRKRNGYIEIRSAKSMVFKQFEFRGKCT